MLAFPRLRPSTSISVAGLSAAVLVALSWLAPGTASAQNDEAPAKPPKAASTEKPAPKATASIQYVPPEKATPEELLEFLDKLRSARPPFKNQQQAIEHAIKVHQASITVGSRLLAMPDLDADLSTEAAELKLGSLQVLAANNIGDAREEGLKAAEELSKDSREEVATMANEAKRFFRLIGVPLMAAPERDAFVEEVLKELLDNQFAKGNIQMAMQLGNLLEQSEDSAVPAAYYNKLAELIETHKPDGAEEIVPHLKGIARRVGLPGNTMEVFGTTVDGEQFDWAKYRGKVVLVDFWATWCGPCMAELPNVKRNYEKYHNHGFEVVGISLDDDTDRLQTFLKEEDIRWTTLFPAKADEMGWNNPLARHYGINGIPTAILVDAEGKVVSMNARGTVLDGLLEKLLPGVE